MTITPDPDWNGTVNITVDVIDGNTGQDSQIVQVTVDPQNDDPILDEIPNVSFPEDQTFDQAFTVSDLLFYDHENGLDPESTGLSFP